MSAVLVQYGLGAWIGPFLAAGDLSRGSRVLVRSARGVEVGTVLDSVRDGHTHFFAEPPGEVLRFASSEDESRSQSLRQEVGVILDAAQVRAAELQLPLLFLDGEILLDGSRAVLQAVHHDECNATPLFEELSERFGLPVMLHDLTAAPAKELGCGKAGCGSGGCSSCGSEGGCSSGSCSRGAAKAPEELTRYFAQLRQQMEAGRERIPLS